MLPSASPMACTAVLDAPGRRRTATTREPACRSIHSRTRSGTGARRNSSGTSATHPRLGCCQALNSAAPGSEFRPPAPNPSRPVRWARCTYPQASPPLSHPAVSVRLPDHHEVCESLEHRGWRVDVVCCEATRECQGKRRDSFSADVGCGRGGGGGQYRRWSFPTTRTNSRGDVEGLAVSVTAHVNRGRRARLLTRDDCDVSNLGPTN